MSTLPKIIAVDFDGTLFENAWPDVGATIVVATYSMSKYIQMAAAQMGKKIPVPITVTNYIRLLASGGLGKSQKYLVDELQMMLEQMNVEAATVDSRYVEVLSDPQKEGL